MKVLIIRKDRSDDCEKVIQWLELYGASCIVLEPSSSFDLVDFQISDSELKFVFNLDDQLVDLDEIQKVWIENGIVNSKILNSFSILEKLDLTIFNFLKREWNTVVSYFFYILEKKSCLGSFKYGFPNKLIQLETAASFGIKIPLTQIMEETNNCRINDNFITKPIQEVFDYCDSKVNYYSSTCKFEKNEFEIDKKCFPFLIQVQVEKKFELRIFFLESSYHTCAIFSQDEEEAKMDFRRFSNIIRMVPFKLPKKIENKLIALMKKLNLNTGSIDMIYTKDKEYVFLEVNPVGIFENISYHTNGFFHKKIAKKIAYGF